MSRQNKVNPGMYTQRGRLTQDDAARELRKQSAFGSPHTWQPVSTRRMPRLAPAGDAAHVTERSADDETKVATLPRAKARPASRETRNVRATKPAPKAKAGARKAKTATANAATTRQSKRTAGTAKARKTNTGKGVTRATKRTATKRRTS